MTGSSPFRHRLSNILKRDPQLIGTFEARDPHSGYYNDLRSKAIELGSRADASAALRSMTADRRLANAVSVVQLGLGAWQLSADEPEWLPVVAEASEWIAAQLDGDGLFAYRFAMPHTYDLEPPWYSAMAQGEAASLLVRASRSLGRVEFLAAAARAIGSLLDDRSGLVAETAEGPVLQEYPTRPPAHALNGWIFALWGLYDVGLVVSPNSDGSSTQLAPEAEKAFKHGSDALSGRLRHYDAGLNWSRYDLFLTASRMRRAPSIIVSTSSS